MLLISNREACWRDALKVRRGEEEREVSGHRWMSEVRPIVDRGTGRHVSADLTAGFWLLEIPCGGEAHKKDIP